MCETRESSVIKNGESFEMRGRTGFLKVFALLMLNGCGEPMYDNAGSQHSLLEDREACIVEMEQGPEAVAYRQNPAAHPEYGSQVFEEMNRCIERKGWKQVRSQQEQEQISNAIAAEATHAGQPASISDPKTSEALVRGVEERLTRASSSLSSGVKKD